MKTLNFAINIKAPKETVWAILWADETYPRWAEVFCEGSYAVSKWQEGDRVHFLSPSGEGMYSVIEKSVANEFLSFKHLGVLKDKTEQPLDEATKQWSGSLENYALKEVDGTTSLSVEIEVLEKYLDFFNGKFPLALENVRQLAEERVSSEEGRQYGAVAV
jgi:hypothetical protein